MAEHPKSNGGAAKLDKSLTDWRLRELERRVGRLEAFVLGNLMAVALAVASALFVGIGLPLSI